jgi:hypothetical protein
MKNKNMKIKMKLKLIIPLSIIGLILLYFIISRKNIEKFYDSLNGVDAMDRKMDQLADQEKETRAFCKILRHDNSNKEQMTRLLELRNKQFSDSLKKQNQTISDIKRKIINAKLDKNNKEFIDINSDRNRKVEGNDMRKKIMEDVKKLIKGKPQIFLTVKNNI